MQSGGSLRKATGVGVLDHISAILDTVEQGSVTTSAVARSLGLSTSTAHRLVKAMVQADFLAKGADGGLSLGPRMAASLLERLVSPVMLELRDATGASTQIWVRRDDDRLCLIEFEALGEFRMSVPAGVRLPLAEGGSAAEVLLREDVDDGRRWMLSMAARLPGACSVSAPVRSARGTVAALCVSVAISQSEGEPDAVLGPRVADAADRISAALADARRADAELLD